MKNVPLYTGLNFCLILLPLMIYATHSQWKGGGIPCFFIRRVLVPSDKTIT